MITNNRHDVTTDGKSVNLDHLILIFTWFALNGALVWCAWEGVINGNLGAGRMLAFAAWFFTVVYLLIAIIPIITTIPKEVFDTIVTKKRSVPVWISQGYNAGMIVFLVWNGWWWAAMAFVLLAFAEAVIYHKPNTKWSHGVKHGRNCNH